MKGQVIRNWGNKIYKAREIRIIHMCDLCDKETHFKYIRKVGGAVYLCPNCYMIINSMHGGNIKESVMRFLMGNVL